MVQVRLKGRLDSFYKLRNVVILSFKTFVNGEIRQDGNTKDMIFSFADMVSYISKNITLEPGEYFLYKVE